MKETIKLLQITDTHLFEDQDTSKDGIHHNATCQAVINHAKAHHSPDLVLFTGDLVDDITENTYQNVARMMNDFDCPVHWIPGNHDDIAMATRVLTKAGFPYASHIIQKKWQYICLNSHQPGKIAGKLEKNELEQLEKLLTNHPEKHTLIATHHHPLPIGHKAFDQIRLENGEALVETILRAAPLDKTPILIFGHVHQVVEMDVNNKIKLFATPSTCKQYLPEQETFIQDKQPPGYRWFELCDDGSFTTGIERVAG